MIRRQLWCNGYLTPQSILHSLRFTHDEHSITIQAQTLYVFIFNQSDTPSQIILCDQWQPHLFVLFRATGSSLFRRSLRAYVLVCRCSLFFVLLFAARYTEDNVNPTGLRLTGLVIAHLIVVDGRIVVPGNRTKFGAGRRSRKNVTSVKTVSSFVFLTERSKMSRIYRKQNVFTNSRTRRLFVKCD